MTATEDAPEGVRLQKVLANAGVASRRVAEDLIVEGRVRVNGKVVTELGTRIDPDGRQGRRRRHRDPARPDQALRPAQQADRRGELHERRSRPPRPPAVHEGLAGAPLQRGAIGCRDQRSAGADQRRRTRARARSSVVRRHEGVHREGRRTRRRADDREAHPRSRAGGRPDRGRQGAAAVDLRGWRAARSSN